MAIETFCRVVVRQWDNLSHEFARLETWILEYLDQGICCKSVKSLFTVENAADTENERR